MDDVAKLLSSPTNYAVVHLPGRRFPGVVFQGDSLHMLTKRVYELKKRIAGTKACTEEVERLFDEIIAPLQEGLTRYEEVCEMNRIALPYPKPSIADITTPE